MKPTFSTIITLFFFLFTFSTKTPQAAAATPEPVLDISGEKLKAGESYFVLPAGRGRGGGLTFGTFGDSCPRVVVQERFETSKGEPVQFLPANPKNHVIFTSRNLNVQFSRRTTSACDESRVWKLTKFISEAMNVGINGIAGNQDFSTISNWFMIEKAEFEGVYKLKFCPKEGVVTCEDLGVFSANGDGKRYVGLANPGQFQQLRVVFQKAQANEEGDIAMST
ncbi:kunitz trypsin inhibitor 2-like [Neltuma alba]|uniref:kunitz trypsin inhibitor 2-like n=1 Tax=Neltuma alba TaxID=207710 RepID=UPI0010A4D33B|nr:kunitz trypsin inhibitor 2-like [Prosopis alba]